MHHCGKLNANICSVGISDQNGKHLVCMCKKEDGKEQEKYSKAII